MDSNPTVAGLTHGSVRLCVVAKIKLNCAVAVLPHFLGNAKCPNVYMLAVLGCPVLSVGGGFDV